MPAKISSISVPPGPSGPPLLFQSSVPLTPSSAANNSVPPASTSSSGLELIGPG